MALDPDRVINGSFGQVFIDGNWESNFNHMEANVEAQKAEIKPSGTRWVKHKIVGLKGTGTITGLKLTSKLIAMHNDVRDDTKGTVTTELVSKLDDPEAYGYERIRLMGVKFDRIQLANWTAGEPVNEEWPFTFEDFELLDPIVES